jgi:hypothetical protein
VLAVNQDAAGKRARRLTAQPSGAEVWVKELSDGATAVGFFNRTAQPLNIRCAWRDLGFATKVRARDLWLRTNLGAQKEFVAELPAHGCALLRLP